MLQTTVKVEGMMCPHCEAHVNDAIRKQFKVRDVQSSHVEGTTVITSDAALDADALTRAVTDAGYKVLDIQSTEIEQKRSWFRRK